MQRQPGLCTTNVLGLDLETDGLSPTTGRKFHFQTSIKFFFPDSLHSKYILFCKQSREDLPAETAPRAQVSLSPLKLEVRLESAGKQDTGRWKHRACGRAGTLQ